jgi:sporulation protein YlmC with PRC-barrel domain
MAGMPLGRSVLDKELLDCNGAKAGKVDDLRLQLRPGARPVVAAIVTGQGTLSRYLGSWTTRLATAWRRHALHLAADGEPVEIGWEHVTRIDVTVQIDLDRDALGVMRVEDAIWDRWIRHLPWARR